MHRRVSLLFLVAALPVFFTLACASGGGNSRPSGVAAPEIRAEIAGSVFFGSGNTAPANVDVYATNQASVPIVLRRVQVDSPGMATYTLVRTTRDVRQTIAPGATERVTVFSTAVTEVRNPSEPLTIRVIADFELGKDRWREIAMTR
jgi:hypothetical protein